jgi:hypothetical protein
MLADLNGAVRQLVDELNMRVMRGYDASRVDLFATLDRPHKAGVGRPGSSSR